MTGEKKPGLYRIINGDQIRFFRVRFDDNSNLIAVELVHKDNIAHEVNKQPLTESLWEKLQRWQ
jgi:hypothetical protein